MVSPVSPVRRIEPVIDVVEKKTRDGSSRSEAFPDSNRKQFFTDLAKTLGKTDTTQKNADESSAQAVESTATGSSAPTHQHPNALSRALSEMEKQFTTDLLMLKKQEDHNGIIQYAAENSEENSSAYDVSFSQAAAQRVKQFFTDLVQLLKQHDNNQPAADEAAKKIAKNSSGSSHTFSQVLVDLARQIKQRADAAKRKAEEKEAEAWVKLAERIMLHEHDLKKHLEALKKKKENKAILAQAIAASQKIIDQSQNKSEQSVNQESGNIDISILNFLLITRAEVSAGIGNMLASTPSRS